MLLGALNITVCLLAGLVNLTGRVNRKKVLCVNSLETVTRNETELCVNSTSDYTTLQFHLLSNARKEHRVLLVCQHTSGFIMLCIKCVESLCELTDLFSSPAQSALQTWVLCKLSV